MMFTMQEPYYGILLSSMQRVPTNKIQTLGVTRSGNVFKLLYNPDFVGQFDIDTTLGLLKHEVLHIAFSHFTIWDGEDKNDTKEMHCLRNIAADLEVNSYIDRNKMSPSAGGVWVEDFGWARYEGTREYFAKLLQKAQQQQQQQNNPAPQEVARRPAVRTNNSRVRQAAITGTGGRKSQAIDENFDFSKMSDEEFLKATAGRF